MKDKRVLTSHPGFIDRKLQIGCPFQSGSPASLLLSSPRRANSSLSAFPYAISVPPPLPLRGPTGVARKRLASSSLLSQRGRNFYVTRFAMNIDAGGVKESPLFCNWKNFCRAEPAGRGIKGLGSEHQRSALARLRGTTWATRILINYRNGWIWVAFILLTGPCIDGDGNSSPRE